MAKQRASQARLQTAIQWYVSRGYTRLETVTRIEERFSHINRRTLNALLDHEYASRRAASGVNRSSPSRQIDVGTMPTLKDTPATIRANVKFTFKSPFKRNRLTIEVSFDLPSGLSKREFFRMMEAKVLDWLMSKYANRTRRDLENRLDDVELTRLEGI